MKLIRPVKSTTAPAFIFELNQREKEVFCATLKLYPLGETSQHRLSNQFKTSDAANQELLEEAMAQQRVEQKAQVSELINETNGAFRKQKGQIFLTLNAEQLEWILRVLNDIRVGSWIHLGRPEKLSTIRPKAMSAQARFLASMELSGYFQAVLLEAFKA